MHLAIERNDFSPIYQFSSLAIGKVSYASRNSYGLVRSARVATLPMLRRRNEERRQPTWERMHMVFSCSNEQEHFNRILTSVAIAAIAVIALTPLAHAQAQGQVSANPQETTLSEVVVTAERRTVSMQKVDIAASSLGTGELQKKAVTDIAGLQNATPSLSVINQGFSQSINVRGIGLAVASPQVAPGVATYRDGVFLPTQTSLYQPFYDVQNVQVLRGPQGTFAGQTATGGAVYVNSISPRLDTGITGNFTAGYGNYNDSQFSGGVNLPVSDNFAARVAFNKEDRDSFYRNMNGTSEHPGDLHVKGLRVGMLWKPTDALTVLWKNEYDVYSNDGFAAQPIPGTEFHGMAPTEPFTINYGATGLRFENDYYLSSLQVNYEFSNGITVKTNTGYQFVHFISVADQAAAPVTGYLETDNSPEHVWTGDISVVSPERGPLQWVLGATFFDYRISPLHVVITTPQSVVGIDLRTPKRSFGVFASATYEMTHALAIKGEFRFSKDRVGETGVVTITTPFFSFAIPQDTPTYTDQEATGKISLNWTPDADDLAYVFAARGYKPGGTNAGGSPFAPEIVWDYEAGWKSTSFDGHLRSQLGVFYTDYKNFQVSEFNPAAQGSSVKNAGTSSSIKGAEAQIQLQFGAFGADAALAYVKSNIGTLRPQIDTRSLPNGGVGLGPPCVPGEPAIQCFDYDPYVQSIPNGPNIYSPEVTANIGLQYAFDVSRAGTLTPRVDASYMGAQWATFFESPADRLKARVLVNGQLNYLEGDWKVQAYATNVFNKVYVSGFSVQFGSNYYLLAPRQFGIRVTRSF